VSEHSGRAGRSDWNKADNDRWSAYHQAQSMMLPAILVMLALAILWAALAGFTIWKLCKKAEHEIHDAA
jgi:hypothetical protein